MMRSEAIKFGLFIAKTAVAVFLLDFAIGKTLEVLHGRIKDGERGRAHYAINESAADVYVLGSSRALYHYNPLVLQDSLGLSVYNAGRSAQTMLYHLPVFKMILKRNVPKIVILDINENEFVKEARKYDLVNSLLPYYRSDESVRQMVDLVKPGYRYFSWSRTLPFNSSVFAILYRSVSSSGERRDINGYISMKGHKTLTRENLHNCGPEFEYDPKIIEALHEFVALCHEKNIKLLVVTSPRFLVAECQRTDLLRVQEELKRLKVSYIDYSDDAKYVENLNYMYDESHLNDVGSEEFTREIAGYVKKWMK